MIAAEQIYKRLPVWGQHAAVSGYGLYWHWIRFGPGFRRYCREYAAREHFTYEQWQLWQQARLKQLLSGALLVPYYKSTWNREERSAALAGRLADLPLVGKEPLRASPEQFLRSDIHTRFRMALSTSGSTGTPITNFWTWPELRDSRAVREMRSARWAGVSFQQPRATFSGRYVEPDPHSPGPFHRYNRIERQLCFSVFHIRPDTAHHYLRALERYGIRWITGYAVAAYLLAQIMLEEKLSAPASLEAIVTTSEKVTPEMRAVMEDAFQCRVFEEYSAGENCIFASECEHGCLHVSPDVGILEILRPDGSPCDPGESGEVVATGLSRHYQPLIRYRLGDVACWSDTPCACGRQMPVLKDVLGRIEDVVIGPDGRRMVRFHGVFVNLPHVREGQVIQESLCRIRVKVVPIAGFNQTDVQDIQQRVQQRLGRVDVAVETVPQIPRTRAGKFKAVVSLLNQTAEVAQ